VPGFHVFDNLYIYEGAYVAVTDRPDEFPGATEVVRKSNDDVKTYWRTMAVDDVDEMGDVAGVLQGVTIIFNDPPGPAGYLAFHSNFLTEAFAGALKVLGSAPPLPGLNSTESIIPKRFIFANCRDDLGWRDNKNLNAWLLFTAFPGASIEEKSTWAARASSGVPVVAERAVVVDRWSAQSKGGEPGKWGKMNAGVATVSTPMSWFEPVRKAMLDGLGIQLGRPQRPVVLYLDNQDAGRRLGDEDHQLLIHSLKSLTDIAEVHVVKLNQMKLTEQVQVLSRADVGVVPSCV